MTINLLTEHYIEHETKLRVHAEKFDILEEAIKKIDNKMNVALSLIVGSIVIPLLLKWYELL